MLDRILLLYLRPDAPRILPKLRQAIGALQTYVELMLVRYAAVAGEETSGMRILEQILGDTDIPSLRRIKDDYDRYLQYLLPLQEDLVRHIDPAVQGVSRLGSFVTTAPGGREYLIPVAARDYLETLPFNQPWEKWEALRPLKLLYSDSADLSLNAYFDKLRYRTNEAPQHAVVALDAIMLVMQYAKYLDTHPADQQLSIKDYLHRYVIYPGLLRDSVTVWLLQQYTKTFIAAETEQARPPWEALTTPTMGSFGIQFPAAMEELWSLATLAQEQNLSPPKILSSLLLETTSVTKGFRLLHHATEIPPLRQYFWVQYLATFGWRNLVFATMALTRAHPMSKASRILVQREFHLLNATRFWMMVPDNATQKYLQEDFQTKLAILDTGW